MKLDDHEFRLLREYIRDECGITLGPDKKYLVESRLGGLLGELECRSFADLHRKAVEDRTRRVRDRIVDAMTTNETLWFRDGEPFRVLRERLFPAWCEEIRAGKRERIRTWCAACSTGQEPYSIAITWLEYCRLNPEAPREALAILATDISESALAQAEAGAYNAVEMERGLDPAVRDRWFTREGRNWRIKDEVRAFVTFRRFNLQDSLAPLGSFTAVFLRYVAIYFDTPFKRDLFDRIARALEPGGVLFLGASESLAGHSDAFETVQEGRAVWYVPRGTGEAARRAPSAARAAKSPAEGSRPQVEPRNEAPAAPACPVAASRSPAAKSGGLDRAEHEALLRRLREMRERTLARIGRGGSGKKED